jgi:hypothetical protein
VHLKNDALLNNPSKLFIMKRISLVLSLSLFFLQIVKSQDSLEKFKSYKIVVNQVMPGSLTKSVVKGYFATIQDSALYVSGSKIGMSFNHMNTEYLQKIDYKTLTSVKLYDHSKSPMTMLFCMVGGAAIGAIIGSLGGNDTGWFGLTSGEKAFFGGLIGVGAGALVGTIIVNSRDKKFLINGEWTSLEEMKESLKNDR